MTVLIFLLLIYPDWFLLNRFHYVNDEWQKRTTYVRFPVDSFQLQQNSPSYALYAVVVGNLSSSFLCSYACLYFLITLVKRCQPPADQSVSCIRIRYLLCVFLAVSAHLCLVITPNPVRFILFKDTAFCRGISDGFWYEYDDSAVTRIPESRIQVSPGKLCFLLTKVASRFVFYTKTESCPMAPLLCARCGEKGYIKRPKTGDVLCKSCFSRCFEDEVHWVIKNANLISPGDKIAIGASGGKDSTVLAYVMKLLNERHHYGAELLLLSIDEGISGYRDESLETVKRNQMQYDLPLTILSYEDLFGWSMDAIVQKVGNKRNCTFCGIFRRQALDKGALMLQATKICTGHNADDVAETVLMNKVNPCNGPVVPRNILTIVRHLFTTSTEPSSSIQTVAKREGVRCFLANARDFAMYRFRMQFLNPLHLCT
ncbi:PP-loop family protein, partial [Opisthorchis viverrini]